MVEKIKIEGMDCATCAYDIEKALKKRGFENASVNFITGEVVVDKNIEKAKKIIKEVKPEIKIVDVKRKKLSMLYFIIPSFFLLLCGAFLMYYFHIESIIIFVLFVIAYVIVGWKVFKSAFINIAHGKLFDENFLIMIATVGAFAIHEYPEAVAVMLFYVVGEFFQDKAVENSKRSVKSLLELKVEYANLLKDDRIIVIPPEKIRRGDIILVKPGERVPVDGIVIKGESTVDTSALTGESVPRNIKTGDTVLSGMLNLTGILKVRVTKEMKESTVSRILKLVEDATTRKARTEKFITKFAHYYTPAVVSLAAGIAIIPPIIFNAEFSVWVARALVLLVISCPCALVLSIPLGYFGGIGKSAKEGILVKGSNFLDSLATTEVVAFDKTGTLTKGVFKVISIVPRNGFGRNEILRFAALAEKYSSHPVANAIKEAYGKEIDDNNVKEYREISGFGVKAKIGNLDVIVGNDRILHRFGVEHDTCNVEGTVVHVAVNGRYAGYIIISDEIKSDAIKAVKTLKDLGIKNIVMLTGDNSKVARDIARKLKLDGYYAELLPEDKVRVVEQLMKDGKTLIFVGDGINDAPVIARADVGIAMGAMGSDAAIETADVVIMDDKLLKIPESIKISRKTKSIVWQNILLALGVKFGFITLGIMGEATMWEAVFADVGVALIAVFNAMRILR